MPLIVEDGTGVANADSLATVAFADTYHANRGHTVWAGIVDVARKEQLLRLATDYIKYIFGPSFIGVKAVSGQALPFPRIVDYVNIGVPLEVQEATAELALVAHTARLMPGQSTVRKKSVKVGPISVEYDANSGPRFVSATARLAPLLGGHKTAAAPTARLVRT